MALTRYGRANPLDRAHDGDAKIFNNKLREWDDYYNYHRPHGGLNGQTPYERLRQITQTPAVTDERQSHSGTQVLALAGGR